MTFVGAGDGDVPTGDLLLVVVSVVVAAIVALSRVGEWRALALVVGFPFVVLVPGYALVSALFPRARDTPLQSGASPWISRLGLSVGGSVVAVALVALPLNYTVWGFQRTPVVAGLCLLTLAATAVAWYRRSRHPPEVRAGVDAAVVGVRLRSLVAGGGIVGIVLSVVVIVTAAGAVGLVVDETTETGSVTEFYVLGENESGDLVAGSYPETLTVDEPATVGVGVGAAGNGGLDGTVVVRLERVSIQDETVVVEESTELNRISVQVDAGERSVTRHTVRPTVAGERLRLTYRLYGSEAETPLRRLQLWVTVESAT